MAIFKFQKCETPVYNLDIAFGLEIQSKHRHNNNPLISGNKVLYRVWNELVIFV